MTIPYEEMLVVADSKKDAAIKSGLDRRFISKVILQIPNALVLDSIDGIGLEFVCKKDIPAGAQVFTFDNKNKNKLSVYFLIRDHDLLADANGVIPLKSYERPADITTTSKDLRRYTEYDAEVKTLLPQKKLHFEAVSMGALIGIFLIEFVFIWIMVQG